MEQAMLRSQNEISKMKSGQMQLRIGEVINKIERRKDQIQKEINSESRFVPKEKEDEGTPQPEYQIKKFNNNNNYRGLGGGVSEFFGKRGGNYQRKQNQDSRF